VKVAALSREPTGIGGRSERSGDNLSIGSRPSEETRSERSTKSSPRVGRCTGDGDLSVQRLLARAGPEHFGSSTSWSTTPEPSRSPPELTADDFDAIFAVDVRAAFLAPAAGRAMGERGGVIVNITSVHEHVPRFAPMRRRRPRRDAEWSLAPGSRRRSRSLGRARRVDVERNETAERLRSRSAAAGGPREVASLVSWLVSDGAVRHRREFSTGRRMARQTVELCHPPRNGLPVPPMPRKHRMPPHRRSKGSLKVVRLSAKRAAQPRR
jgi:hypothetical protein